MPMASSHSMQPGPPAHSSIAISRHSGIFTLLVAQQLPVGIDEAWAFFSNPGNLARITPKNIGFEVTSAAAECIYQGQIISYRLGIFPFFKTNWVTEIVLISPRRLFIDEQRFGPYAMWQHEHHFEENDYGVLMQDRLSYKLPLGFVGNVFGGKIIKKKVLQIFEHRYNTLKKIFPT